jgi:hypothetical protein
MFWVFCAFVATMIMLCVWMLVSRESTPQQTWPYRFAPESGVPATVTTAVAGPTEGHPAGS